MGVHQAQRESCCHPQHVMTGVQRQQWECKGQHGSASISDRRLIEINRDASTHASIYIYIYHIYMYIYVLDQINAYSNNRAMKYAIDELINP